MCTYRGTSPTPGVPSHTHTPGTCVDTLPSHLEPLSSKRLHPLLLCPHCPTPTSPTPEKVQLGGPQGCTGNALYTMGQQAIFCPRAGGRLGREQPGVTQSAVFCLFLCLSPLPSVLGCQSLCLLSVFLFRPQGLFDPIPFDTFHYCLHTLQILAQIHLFQKAFPDSYLIRTLPLCSQSSEQMPSEHWADELVSTSC